VVSVAGFPLGAGTPEAKAYEALVGVDAGAGEIDMVANLGALRASDVAHVTHDIEAVVETVKTTGTPITLKVILETRILTNEQIILGCRCAAAAGADFVKTSTGFHLAGGATTEHVTLLRQHAAPLKVKASGGIRDLPTAKAMIAAGADRLGTTASVAIIADLPA
jgi:deoxyribose-phosphate aldolase